MKCKNCIKLEKEIKDYKYTIEIMKDAKLMKNLAKAYKEYKEGKCLTKEQVFGHLDS